MERRCALQSSSYENGRLLVNAQDLGTLSPAQAFGPCRLYALLGWWVMRHEARHQ